MRKSRTSPEAIERQMRLAGIMAQRARGRTFKEIGMMMQPTISAQAVHKAFWRTLRDNPPSRRRTLALHRRLAALDGDAV